VDGGFVRRLKVLTLAACLAVFGAARAAAPPRERIDLRVSRDPLRLILRDGLVGGLAGVAVGGGVLGIMSATGQGQRNWASVLATSAGIGLAVGVVWGVVESGSAPSAALALRPAKDGLSFGDQHTHDLSGTVMLPVFGHRF
jgi:hypothetical protein